MAKLYCPIQFQHQADDFWAIYKASVCVVERRRAQFFALRAEGRSEDEVMEITKYGVTTARLMIGRYHELGLAGLQDGRAQNRGRRGRTQQEACKERKVQIKHASRCHIRQKTVLTALLPVRSSTVAVQHISATYLETLV